MRSKVTIVGAGGVGFATAYGIAEKGYADVVLIDVVKGLAKGRALDIIQCSSILQMDTHVLGTDRYGESADSDIVVVSAGIGRKPNMSRDELLEANATVIRGVVGEVVKYSPDCIILVVTNPLDPLVWLALYTSKFSRDRVIGLSGLLDSARFKALVAAELNVSAKGISACIMGAHGDTMVPVLRLCTVGGIPITQLLPAKRLTDIVKRTIEGGAEIVSLQGSSATLAPAAAVVQMVDAILLDRKEILPCSVYLNGEYGIRGVVGVPVKLGKKGLEQVLQIELTEKERSALKKSADAVKAMSQVIGLEEIDN
ncbi:MAG: malate dehydrogenase [Chloroflexota bacterium]|nr:malate dehydrogenase [Chloroflexota bacterium]